MPRSPKCRLGSERKATPSEAWQQCILGRGALGRWSTRFHSRDQLLIIRSKLQTRHGKPRILHKPLMRVLLLAWEDEFPSECRGCKWRIHWLLMVHFGRKNDANVCR